MPSYPSSSTPSVRQKRRRWPREQLLKSLQILNDLAAPLPPTLPPSPPASRSASPAPGFKRKLDSSSDPDSVKRPRTSSISDRQHHTQSSISSSSSSSSQLPQHPHNPQPTQLLPQPPNRLPPSLPPPPLLPPSTSYNPRSEPCEDGEVREEPVPPAAPSAPRGSAIDVPIRRPKKGKPSWRHFDALHDKYHNAGRLLKYSGDARFWSTYPPGHKEYRPLLDPPHPSSPYHKHGGLIARLELLDALICFTYSIWNRDYSRRTCSKETWKTIEAFHGWCKHKWQTEEATNDRERAFLGLIWMIDAFIKGRKTVHTVRNHLDSDIDKVLGNLKVKAASAVQAVIAEGDLLGGVNAGLLSGKLAPPMLPSPNSANSTPVNRDEGTPSTSGAKPTPTYPPGRPSTYSGSVPYKIVPDPLLHGPQPIPPPIMNAMAAVTEPIGPNLASNVKDVTSDYNAAALALQTSQVYLNLPLLRRCFPNTWARMMFTSLLPSEEHEPDFEDEEGELYWPGQCMTGEGIGWVCLMGKAMIKEFGKEYGYKGVDGVVPKPKPEELAEQQQSQDSSQAAQRTGPPPGHGPRPPVNVPR